MLCPCGGKAIRFDNTVRVIRFASETLPGQTGTDKGAAREAEVKNTQYPEFKKWLPPFLIKKDITARNSAMTIIDPNNGADIIIEFVSYGQTVQSTAGPQRFSIWCDEQPTKDFYEEQLPRLVAADGDFIMTLTPADMITWTYDEIYDRADTYIRSKIVADKFGLSETEQIRAEYDIGVIQAATDDNPTLRIHVIEKLFEKYDDDDAIAIRRYGVFKQVSGRIFKTFDWNTHIIDDRKYFPAGIPWKGTHGRTRTSCLSTTSTTPHRNNSSPKILPGRLR
jgi:phage terminase large subunit-like protein